MDTPRTDAVGSRWQKLSKSEQSSESVELYSLARALERELTAEQKRYDELRVILARETARGDRLEKALRYAIDNPEFDSEKFDSIARAALGDTNG